jgi:hypothetical protein
MNGGANQSRAALAETMQHATLYVINIGANQSHLREPVMSRTGLKQCNMPPFM